MFDLSGQVALVTGGSRGLGREMAAALAEHGASVALCSRSGADAASAAEQIAGESGRATLGIEADVTSRADVTRLVQAVVARFGRLDILVNNAGGGLRRPLLEMSDAEWSSILRVCLDAPFFVARAAVPHMLAHGYGRIVNVSSALGEVALPERGAYCAAKGGLIQLTRVMALEWARSGITVNALCPGPFKTSYNLRLQADPELFESYLDIIPQHRWAELSEIRAAAVFLCSREAGYVTGTSLFVDGGWTAHGGTPRPGGTDPAPRS